MKSERIPRRSHQNFITHQSTSSSTESTKDRKTMPKTLKFPSSIMSDTNDNVSLQQSHELSNPILEPLFHALDPISLILNQNSHSHHQPFPLRLTTSESFIMERGPRYKAYSELRETRLRMKEQQQQQQEEHEEVKEPNFATPPRKKVNFQDGLVSGRKGYSSILAQSVPDFTAVLRKENKKPVNTLIPMMEMTPPMKSKSFSYKGNDGVLSGSRGSKSASAGEKKKGGGVVLMARKSYASIDELKNLSSVTANAINGEGKGGRNNSRVMGRTVSGYCRQF